MSNESTAPNSPGSSSEDSEKMRVSFDYEKGNLYRVIHMDGAHGGVSPSGDMILMSVFNERRPIPQREEYDVTKDGRKTKLPSKIRPTDIYREVEATLVMNEECARALRAWLTRNLAQLEKMKKIKGVQIGDEGGAK